LHRPKKEKGREKGGGRGDRGKHPNKSTARRAPPAFAEHSLSSLPRLIVRALKRGGRKRGGGEEGGKAQNETGPFAACIDFTLPAAPKLYSTFSSAPNYEKKKEKRRKKEKKKERKGNLSSDADSRRYPARQSHAARFVCSMTRFSLTKKKKKKRGREGGN